MLPCLGNNLPISHDSDSAGDDIFPALRRHLNVHSSSVALVLSWHLRVSVAIPDVMDLGFVGVYRSSKLVDMAVGFCEPLIGDGCYCRDGNPLSRADHVR